MAFGQSTVLRPWLSRYHDEQPPVFHTVRFIRRWTPAFHLRCAAARGSTAAYPCSRIVRRASRR